MKYWFFFLFAGCQTLVQEQVFQGEANRVTQIMQGMSREEISSILGHPEKKSESPFQREQWIYPIAASQLTYSNQETPSLYIFKRKDAENSTLSLLFDEKGHLESFSSFPSPNQNFLAGEMPRMLSRD